MQQTPRKLTAPKPDVTYAFPIFKTTDNLPLGYADSPLVHNFSIAFLKSLVGDNFRCAVTSKLQRLREEKEKLQNLQDHDFMCFPWAIVEAKRAQVGAREIEECYCQAANGTAAIISTYRALFRSSITMGADDLPPAIAFTCVGSRLKVWLTYLDEDGGTVSVQNAKRAAIALTLTGS